MAGKKDDPAPTPQKVVKTKKKSKPIIYRVPEGEPGSEYANFNEALRKILSVPKRKP